MPYAPDHDGGFWYPERRPSEYFDTQRRAAEQLALDVETYLYAEKTADGAASPAYMNPSYLAWAVARYDATKTSSGNIFTEEYDPVQASEHPLAPPAGRVNPNNQADNAIRFPADAVAAPAIQTEFEVTTGDGGEL